jgi:hypothetical protein
MKIHLSNPLIAIGVIYSLIPLFLCIPLLRHHFKEPAFRVAISGPGPVGEEQ